MNHKSKKLFRHTTICISSLLLVTNVSIGLEYCFSKQTNISTAFTAASDAIPDYLNNDFSYNTPEIIKAASVPKFDPRQEANYLPPVRDQGSEGLCWAYSTIGAAEINAIKTGIYKNPNTLDLSEHNLDWATRVRNNETDFLGLNEADVWKHGEFGDGASTMDAANTLSKWISPSIVKNPAQEHHYVKPAMKMKSVTNLQMPADNNLVFVPDDPGYISSIKKAIIKNGSCSFAYPLEDPNYSPWETYYNYPIEVSVDYPLVTDYAHAIDVVGWDDNIPATNFAPYQAKNNGGWICRNSWGPDLLENGYFYMSYESYNYNTLSYSYMPADNTYENNYYWDAQCEDVLDGTVLNNMQKAVAIFPVKKANNDTLEDIDGVQISVNGVNVQVKFNIYDNVSFDETIDLPSVNKLDLGNPVYTQKVTFDYPGTYTVKLNKSIPIYASNYFAVEAVITGGKEIPGGVYYSDMLGFEFAEGSETSSQNDLTFVSTYPYGKDYHWTNTIDPERCQNPVVRLDALTNTKKIGNPPTTNDIKYADLKLDSEIIHYDDPSTYPTFNSLTLNGQNLSPYNFDFIYEPVMWKNSADNFEKRIGTVKVTLLPKSENYKGKLYTYLTVKGGSSPYIDGLGKYSDTINDKKETIKNARINLLKGPGVKTYRDLGLEEYGFQWTQPDETITFPVNNTLTYTKSDAKYFTKKTWSNNDISFTNVTHTPQLSPKSNFMDKNCIKLPSPTVIDKINDGIYNNSISPTNADITENEFNSITKMNILNLVNIPTINDIEKKRLKIQQWFKTNNQVHFTVATDKLESNMINVQWNIIQPDVPPAPSNNSEHPTNFIWILVAVIAVILLIAIIIIIFVVKKKKKKSSKYKF